MTFNGFIVVTNFGNFHKPSVFTGSLAFTCDMKSGQQPPTENRKSMSDLHIKTKQTMLGHFTCHLELGISKTHLQKLLKEK